MPRPSKCTPEIREKILNLVRLGNFREVACRAVGINSRTLRIWLERGENGERPYAQFAEDLEKAEAEAEAVHVTRISAASRNDWRASAFYLSRKVPDRWGDQIALKIEDGLQRILDIVQDVCPPEVFRRVLDALAAADRAPQAQEPGGKSVH